MWKTNLSILIALLAAQYANADCNVCNSNGAACITNNTFQLCFNGVPQNPVWTCPNAGDVCTTLGLICADPASNAQIRAACGDTAQCGNCANVADGAYSCTSRNTFVMCSSGAITNIAGTCPTGLVCLTSRANAGTSPCVNQCLTNALDMCDINTSSTTAATPTVTPSATSSATTSATPSATTPATTSATPSVSPTASVENTVCATSAQVGRYAYPNDTTCTRYIYCYTDNVNGGLAGRPMSCPTGRYFNSVINNCQVARPTGCV